jgi:hypothetical protein
MPKHRVEISEPSRRVLNSDVEFTVYSDGSVLGTLFVSKGSIDWRPAGHQKAHHWTWEQFARVMTGE